ncbi:helix-turn-helix domain-containing protein [Streptomyces sp. NBC_00247]|uniref:ArsR/SmtB family transcription factor n=1 Tax=Streptomyces sp. NBC_00247 TaxID=2975689 RepID=UPI002E2C5E02|nr:helix-turn-helix domain-containing protein [Streptomyces sp. NBC_00247]
MIRFRLSLSDLAATSFAYSPLQETVLSLRLWGNHAARMPHLRRLRTAMRPAFERLDQDLLTSLVARRRYWVPDLLTPRPHEPAPGIRSELTALRAVDPARLGPELEQTFHPLGEPVPPRLLAGLADPARLLADIADALEAYWHACLLPRWPRIRSVLETDIAHRARTLTEHGAGHLFSDISPRLTWTDGVLSIHRNGPWAASATDIPIDGRRLLLTPSCFVDGVSTMLGPGAPPHIIYTARGLATLTESPPPSASPSLDRLLGAPRARLLTLLAEPASTTELAHQLHVTPAAVSQHLSVLAAARLVDRTRHGRHVLYRQSPLGTALHQAQQDTPPDQDASP